jgi:hemerythrin-like domain-containing protein
MEQRVVNPTTNDTVLEWVRRRASEDSAMQEAEARRDAAPAPPDDPDGEHDVIDEIGRDHNQVKALLEQLSAIPGVVQDGTREQRSARASIVDMITVALSEHESLEEEYLWPAVRKHLPDGEHLAETALEQEKKGKDLLTALGELSADDEEFDELAEQLTLACRTHVAFEDQVLLRLAEEVPDKQRRRIGRRFHRSRPLTPTRPHPHAPQHSPAVKVAGLAGTAMDAVRDAVSERPADRQGRATDSEDE